MKHEAELSFKFITLVIIAGVIVAFVSPARAVSPAGSTATPAAAAVTLIAPSP